MNYFVLKFAISGKDGIIYFYTVLLFNPSIALRSAKTLWSFGHSECIGVKTFGVLRFANESGSIC